MGKRGWSLTFSLPHFLTCSAPRTFLWQTCVASRYAPHATMRARALIRIVQLGIKSLLLHKMRSGLTMLGIFFGVC